MQHERFVGHGHVLVGDRFFDALVARGELIGGTGDQQLVPCNRKQKYRYGVLNES